MRWSLGTKLIVSTTLAILLLVAQGVTALVIAGSLGNRLDHAVVDVARHRMLAGRVAQGVTELNSLERGLTLAAMMHQTAQFQQMRQDFERQGRVVAEWIDEFRADLPPVELQHECRRLVSEFEQVRRLHGDVLRHLEQHNINAAFALLNTSLLPRLSEMGKITQSIQASENEKLGRLRNEAAQLKSISLIVMIALTLISAVMGAGMLLAVRRLLRVLRQTAEDLGDNARYLATASTQVYSSSQSVSQAATEQAASLEQTSVSAEELERMTRCNVDNSEAATRRTEEAFQMIQKANEALAQMMGSMNEITSSSNKISKIIKVIDDIAFQTNILALNAAVEAARAGEAGAGFAVVAEEVRSLAQRSAQAARDTTELIEESMRSASGGKVRLDEVAETIQSVTNSAQKARSLVIEVHHGSEQQSIGIGQIATVVGQMEKVTVQLAATSEETAASGQQLNVQAKRVDEIALNLHALVHGRAKQAPVPAPAQTPIESIDAGFRPFR